MHRNSPTNLGVSAHLAFKGTAGKKAVLADAKQQEKEN
jgi:hypothetical protein